jgi:hypothetical protein
MRKVAIVVPASPNPRFLSRVAAFNLAMRRLAWSRWSPTLHLYLGGEPDIEAIHQWYPWFREVSIFLTPQTDFDRNGIWAQADSVFSWRSCDADVIVAMDADTLPVRNFEDVLDRVADSRVVAGTIAHNPGGIGSAASSRELWDQVSAGLVQKPLDLRYQYPLLDHDAPVDQRLAPFYVNFGVVFIPQTIFGDLADRYLQLRPKVTDRLKNPFFSGQVALALAISEANVGVWDLPMRYNFPNDELAAQRYPDELANVAIFHYLRTEKISRDTIFASQEHYARFLRAPLRGVNRVFQQCVKQLIGPQYPFCAPSDGNRAVCRAAVGGAFDVLSEEAYRSVIDEHRGIIAPALRELDAQIERAPGALDLDATAMLQARRTILASGLFDADFYLLTNEDVRRAGVDALDHFIRHGDAEGRAPNVIFSPPFYRQQYMKGAPASHNTLVHYVEQGERAGCSASPDFDPHAYLDETPSIAKFVDRPLFHFLKLGHDAQRGLMQSLVGAVANGLPEPAEALCFAKRYLEFGDGEPLSLMLVKQALVKEFGIEQGFARYKQAFPLPDSDHIHYKRLGPLKDFAAARADAFTEIAGAGQHITLDSPLVIGEGNHRPLEGLARSFYVACLDDTRVRGASSLIEVGDVVLMDYEGAELDNVGTEFEFDSAVFHGSNAGLWVIAPEDERSAIEIETAFSLISARACAFGHWLWENLPKMIAALSSGVLPRVPVLIDGRMAKTHRQALELLVPEAEIIEIPPFVTARVARLWCAPTQHFASILEKKNDERFKWDYLVASPERFKAILVEMVRRAECAAGPTNGSERIFLARRPSRHRRLINAEAIEAAAKARGFAVLYPEDFTFVEQFRLIRGARFLVAPAGSAVFLTFFAKPGTKLCILNNTYTADLPLETALYSAVGVESTVVTGPIVMKHPIWSELADYEIDTERFCRFLDRWLADGPSS